MIFLLLKINNSTAPNKLVCMFPAMPHFHSIQWSKLNVGLWLWLDELCSGACVPVCVSHPGTSQPVWKQPIPVSPGWSWVCTTLNRDGQGTDRVLASDKCLARKRNGKKHQPIHFLLSQLPHRTTRELFSGMSLSSQGPCQRAYHLASTCDSFVLMSSGPLKYDPFLS